VDSKLPARPSSGERSVRFLTESQTDFRGFGLAFLCLALAVFAWGLQYKLSLYDPPQAASHQMAHAKLLSKDQQSPAVAHLVIAREETSIGAVVAGYSFVIFFLLLNHRTALSLLVQQRLNEISRRRPVRPFADMNALFFRPPPSIPA